MTRRPMSFTEQIERTPITFLTLVAYLTLFVVTSQGEDGFQLSLSFGGMDSATMADYGAQCGVFLQDGELWRMLSSSFLHFGLLHLVFNSSALWSLGTQIEAALGSVRFTVLYLVSALWGGLFSAMGHQSLVLVAGGSGALFGLLGAITVLQLRGARSALDAFESGRAKPLFGTMAFYLAIGFVIPQISGWGHLGGFLGGIFATGLFLIPRRRGDRSGWILRGAFAAVTLALLARSLHPISEPTYWLMRAEQARDDDEARRWALLRRSAIAGGWLAADEILDRYGESGARAIELRGLDR